jgi:amino acid efflux transporter
MSTDGRLTRALSARDLAVYYLSSLVGVGVLVVPGIALSKAGPASLLAWAILSVASLPIAVTFARFSARYPSAGGVSFLVRQAFGWRPGTAIGLFLLFLNLSTNPILGLAAAGYLAALFGWEGRRRGGSAPGRPRPPGATAPPRSAATTSPATWSGPSSPAGRCGPGGWSAPAARTA